MPDLDRARERPHWRHVVIDLGSPTSRQAREPTSGKCNSYNPNLKKDFQWGGFLHPSCDVDPCLRYRVAWHTGCTYWLARVSSIGTHRSQLIRESRHEASAMRRPPPTAVAASAFYKADRPRWIDYYIDFFGDGTPAHLALDRAVRRRDASGCRRDSGVNEPGREDGHVRMDLSDDRARRRWGHVGSAAHRMRRPRGDSGSASPPDTSRQPQQQQPARTTRAVDPQQAERLKRVMMPLIKAMDNPLATEPGQGRHHGRPAHQRGQRRRR